jgi:hypothetical protein
MVGRRLGGLAGLRGVTFVSGWAIGGGCELLALRARPSPVGRPSERASTAVAVSGSIMDSMLIANKFADIGGNTMIKPERAAYPLA